MKSEKVDNKPDTSYSKPNTTKTNENISNDIVETVLCRNSISPLDDNNHYEYYKDCFGQTDKSLTNCISNLTLSEQTNDCNSSVKKSTLNTENDDWCEGCQTALSKSLEDEYRFMKELGWEENSDDPFYAPLTEDEVNEFKYLLQSRYGDELKNYSKTSMLSNYFRP